MKKYKKIILIILSILIGIILIDTLQARIRKSSPIISWMQKLDKDSYVDKGILIDTYYCVKDKKVENVSWHFKTTKFICPIYDEKRDTGSIFRTANNIVSLSIKENTLTNTGVTIIMKNLTNSKYVYGKNYYVEHFENDKWNLLEPMTDTLEAYTIKPNQEIEDEFNWESAYGNLPSGKYRIIKDFFNSKDKKDIYSSIEFEIK